MEQSQPKKDKNHTDLSPETDPSYEELDLYTHDFHKSVGAFFHGEGMIGVSEDGTYKVIVRNSITNETAIVGEGYDADEALGASLEIMRECETIETKSIAEIPMNETASVSFTGFAEYRPMVAPSGHSHATPSYVEHLLEGNIFVPTKVEFSTYEKTMQQEDRQEKIRTIVETYCHTDPDGRRLAENLQIYSLSHLTPEQAIKLSAGVPQSIFRYDYDSLDDLVSGNPRKVRADDMTVIELLDEALENKQASDQKTPLLCRQIAVTTAVVFEALKATQTDLSMLRDTYCTYVAGLNGKGYGDNRQFNLQQNESNIGHVWNIAITVDEEGSAVATTFDATWALGKSEEHLDYTQARSAALLFELFEKSESKTEAFDGLTNFTDTAFLMYRNDKRINSSRYKAMCNYLTSEYLGAAWDMLFKHKEALPEGFVMPREIILNTTLIANPQQHEIEALYALGKPWSGFNLRRMKKIISSYDMSIQEQFGTKTASALRFGDPDLQALVIETLGDERVSRLTGQYKNVSEQSQEQDTKKSRASGTIKKLGNRARRFYDR